MTDVGSDIFQIGHNHYLVMDDRYSICCNAHTGYYKIEIATLMPPTNHLWTTRANIDTGQVQITFGQQEPTWVQAKYKLPLGHKSQHGYRPSTNYLWATRANMGTGQVQITFGPEEPTRVQVKSYHLWATKSHQGIKTDIGPQYRAEFDEFCNFNAWTRIHPKNKGVRQAS